MTGDFGTVSGGTANTASFAGTVGGGAVNAATGHLATVGGGSLNTASAAWGTVAGGFGNSSRAYATVSGGYGNTASGENASVGGGYANGANGRNATVGGGYANGASSFSATVGGGNNNQATNNFATVPGGTFNVAGGQYSLAAGQRAQAMHDGTFVWADSQAEDFASTSTNQFLIRATGGVRFSDSTPSLSFGSTTRQMLNLWDTRYGIGVQAGTLYCRVDAAINGAGFAWYRGGVHDNAARNPGGGSELMYLNQWGLTVNGVLVSSSDRHAKENFKAVDTRQVLEQVAALPITTWSFKSDQAARHLGPMAQDFQEAFGLGADDRHIATVDEAGVALAAIQGLNAKVETQNAALRAENTELKVRLQRLERLIPGAGYGATR